ncbi:hydroxyethylthiazole kinase [Candidatus Entotheonella serta]|nr:hydroxyethylthiazole kinase [Candidatus Entotheonella serta]
MEPRVGPILWRVREQRPLLHHITNFVTMNDVANASLHIGATPVMAHAAEEVAEMVSKAQALVLNMGTLTPDRLEVMLIAGRAANASGVPIVLDSVGVGATEMRQAANRLILSELDIALVRGNAAEIGVLAGAGGTMQGVDSVAGAAAPVAVTRQLAQMHRMTVAMTGERDIVSDGESVVEVANGHLWLTNLTENQVMEAARLAIH